LFRVIFAWEENAVPEGNPPVGFGDNMTISHAMPGIKLGPVTAIRGECFTTAQV